MSDRPEHPAAHTTPRLVFDALQMLDEAISKHEPSHVFAMFSGGHDSLTSTAIAAGHPRFTSAVHINTGVGIEETREFVRETCNRHGWPLIEMHRSGECLCGALAKASEISEIEAWFPKAAAELHEYERLAREAGHNDDVWAGRARRVPRAQPKLPLCWSCEVVA